MIVGITGGIGSGKSTVVGEFQQLGIPCYVADVEAKKLMINSNKVKSKIIDLLGEEVYVSGELNRAYISEKVFHNKELLAQLNGIVHPAVHQHLKEFVAQQNAPYCIYESAILYENKNEHLCDKVIVITADLEERIQRVLHRDHVTREAVLARIKNQWSEEKKVKKADFIIENKDINTLKQQVLAVHQQLIQTSS